MISFQTEGAISEKKNPGQQLGGSTQQASLGQGWNHIASPATRFLFYQAPLGVTINWDEDTLRYLPGPGV